MSEPLLLKGGPEDYNFLKKSRRQIDGVDDLEEWRLLKVSSYYMTMLTAECAGRGRLHCARAT